MVLYSLVISISVNRLLGWTFSGICSHRGIGNRLRRKQTRRVICYRSMIGLEDYPLDIKTKVLFVAATSAAAAANQIKSTHDLWCDMGVESRAERQGDAGSEPGGLLNGFECRQEQAEHLDQRTLSCCSHDFLLRYAVTALS
jgi:hypothetical protein